MTLVLALLEATPGVRPEVLALAAGTTTAVTVAEPVDASQCVSQEAA